MMTLDQLAIIAPISEEFRSHIKNRDMSYQDIKSLECYYMEICWRYLKEDYRKRFNREKYHHPYEDWGSLTIALKAAYLIKLVNAGERVMGAFEDLDYTLKEPQIQSIFQDIRDRIKDTFLGSERKLCAW